MVVNVHSTAVGVLELVNVMTRQASGLSWARHLHFEMQDY